MDDSQLKKLAEDKTVDAQRDSKHKDKKGTKIEAVEKLLKEVDVDELVDKDKADFMDRLDQVVAKLTDQDFKDEDIRKIIDYMIAEFDKGNVYLTAPNK